jgi:hypothetical protein
MVCPGPKSDYTPVQTPGMTKGVLLAPKPNNKQTRKHLDFYPVPISFQEAPAFHKTQQSRPTKQAHFQVPLHPTTEQ